MDITNITIIGIGSDIGRELAYRFMADGKRVQGTYHRNRPDSDALAAATPFPQCYTVHMIECDMTNHNHIMDATDKLEPWDAAIFCTGTLSPVGKFFDVDPFAWWGAMKVNCLGPLMLLRYMRKKAREGAQACFMSGPNPFKTSPNYSAYAASKAALVRATKDINAEGFKCFAFAPGFVKTKIHQATIDAGVYNERLERGGGTTHDHIYRALNICLQSPKAGGQHIYAPDIV